MPITQKQKGFTIVELLIVIVVIGILAAITIVAFNGVQDRSRFAKSQSDLGGMKKLLELYKADNGNYPNTIVTGSRTWFFSSNSGANGGDGFIPGIVPTYAPKLPRPTAGAYIYNSDGNEYKLMRYASIPASEWNIIPAAMIDTTGANNKDRYGYWTPGAFGY